MTAYDIKRELKNCYAPKNTEWAIADVPPQQFLAVDGTGDPNTSSDYTAAVESLYAVAYTLKFESKRTLGRDFVVAPLEGLWWADDPAVFVTRDKDAWHWRMLISQPDWITAGMIGDATCTALAKKGNPAISSVRRETLHEGMCAQALHVGSYDDEAPLLAKLHNEWLKANGYELSGLHHEIYLSDPRRAAAARLKTVLRQPVRPARRDGSRT